jgi:hypothetical protein
VRALVRAIKDHGIPVALIAFSFGFTVWWASGFGDFGGEVFDWILILFWVAFFPMVAWRLWRSARDKRRTEN